MAISTNSSVSTLDLSSPCARRHSSPAAGIRVSKKSYDSEDNNSVSDAESVSSTRAIPAVNSSLHLSGTPQIIECTCICPVTGTALGPACRLCRTAEYIMIQEAQARRTQRQHHFHVIKTTISSKWSALSRACHWRKREEPSRPQKSRNSHSKKDSIISWPESEATCVGDEQPDQVESQKFDASSMLDRKQSVSSRVRQLSLNSSSGKGFLLIPDTDEEKEARREAKREEKVRKEAETRRAAAASEELYHDDRGMLDWRVVWAMGGIY